MTTLAENIARNNTFHAQLRGLIKKKGKIIPSDTPCEALLGVLDEAIPEPVFGVSGLSQASASLTRTDDAVGMSFSVDSSTGEISSDFDSLFPWNETELAEDSAGKFLKFPDMYFRVGADSSNRLTDVAVSKAPSGEGSWYKVDSFMYGCYGASVSANALKSASGAARQGNLTIAQFRSYAAANGDGYFQLDLYHRTVLLFLWYIEFATKNSASVMTGRVNGSGTKGGVAKRPTGGTDSLTAPSGFETEYGQMRYHYIEDFIGNQLEYVDGVCCKGVGANDYVTADPANFSDDTLNKSPLAYSVSSNNWLTALGWDDDNPFMCMPADATGGSGESYFCDYTSGASASAPVLFCGARSDYASENYGLSCFNRANAGITSGYIGARLLKAVER